MAKRKTTQTDPEQELANLKYGEARDRLSVILEDLESNEVDIDDLSGKVREAAMLIRVLHDKLTRTRAEVEKVLEDVQISEPEENTAD